MSPSPLQVTVEETGTAKIVADLEGMGIRAEDTLVVWPALDALFHADEAERFEREGPGWKRLADATVQKKEQLGQPPEIMRATNELHRSLTTAATGLAESNPYELKFGTDLHYARFHQYGTTKMPRREVVGVSTKTQTAMVRVLNEFIRHGVG